MLAPARCSDFALNHPPRFSRQKTFLALATRTVFRPPRLARWTLSIAAIALVSALVSGLAAAGGGEQHKIYDYSQAIVSPDANAVDHNTTRSNRMSSAAAPQSFELACAMRCEVGGWQIEVSEASSSDDAILAFRPQDTIYTHGLPLYQPGDTYIAQATAADGYFVNHPGARATPIVGDVYERYGASGFPSVVYTSPLDDGGLSFCEPDPMTGQAPFDFLLDTLELNGFADPATLPLACEDHDGINAYAPGSGFGEPTRGSDGPLQQPVLLLPEKLVRTGLGGDGEIPGIVVLDGGGDGCLQGGEVGGGGTGDGIETAFSHVNSRGQTAFLESPADPIGGGGSGCLPGIIILDGGGSGCLQGIIILHGGGDGCLQGGEVGGGGTGDGIQTGFSHVNSRGQTAFLESPSDLDVARGEPLRGSFTVNVINPKE